MDPVNRQEIHDDLKGLLRGDVLFDDLSCALYSTDASVFQVDPLGVVLPRDEEDLQALVRYASEHLIALVPRGAGTGLAGESLGMGLIVDLSKYFREILEISHDRVRVQSGVVHATLNRQLKPLGRRFAPDPTSGVQCTLGGMLATNASGARIPRFGYTRDHVEALRAVLSDGNAWSIGLEPRHQPAGEPNALQTIVSQLVAVLSSNEALIREIRPRTPFDRCGYRLHDILGDQHLDLRSLLIGSEGTLAFFTEATLRTVPLPRSQSLVVLGFDSLDAGLAAARESTHTSPTACELIDRRIISLSRGRGSVPGEAEAVLFVEYEGDTDESAREGARMLLDRLANEGARPRFAVTAHTEQEIERLWQLRQMALPNLYSLRGGPQPIACVEDVGVPLDSLADYVRRVQDILKRAEVTASFLIHAATGQVHMRPFFDLEQETERGRMWGLAQEVHGLAIEMGGTVSSQHGTGLARTPWVQAQVKQLFPVYREIKAIFDPHNILNPGKIVGPDPALPAWPLRRVPSPSEPPHILSWQAGEIRAEVQSCNGCGHCRTQSPAERMCPPFRATASEQASPRAKANLLRYLLENGRDPKKLASEEVRSLADLCLGCRLCQAECPAHVNVCKLMLELKAANISEHGMSRFEWSAARTEAMSAFSSRFYLLVNFLLGNGLFRWGLEALLGISRRRRLPRFANRSFLSRARERGWTRPPHRDRPRVAYFVDVFANYVDPLIGEAVVEVLHHNGIEVFVPPDQLGCGMAPLAAGDVDSAREVASHNLRLLAELAREGYVILCSEPTAAIMLKQDYPDLLDDSDARLVSLQIEELTSYLWELHAQQQLRDDFRPLPICIGHHIPCHIKALGKPPRGPDLLRLIPGLQVREIDVSCSGMAGTFGLQARNYDVSLAIGRPMLAELDHRETAFGSTECGSCRMQMEEGAGKKTLHPIQYLAMAYGLVPAIAKKLRLPVTAGVLQ